MTTYQIPPDTRAVGTPDPANDMNAVADMLGLIAAMLAQLAGAGTNSDPTSNTTNVAAAVAMRAAQALNPGAAGTVLTSNGASANPTFQQSFVVPTGIKIGTYNAQPGDLVVCDTSGGSFTVNLPTTPAAVAFTPVTVVLINGTNPLTIATSGSDVLDKAGGPVNTTLSAATQAINLQYRSAGGIWYRRSGFLPLPLAVSSGGTGQTTLQAALNALAGATTNNQVLAGNGTNVLLRALVAGDIPNLAESQITNLTTDLAAKAADASVVHLAGTETVTGAKTFSLPPNWATQSVSGTATLSQASAPVVLTDTTSAAFTLTLPAAPVTGEWFIIVDDTGQWNTHNLTIGRNGKNIDGAAANLTLSNQWGKVIVYYDGTAWWVIGAGASNETPVAVGTAAAGTHSSLSRADHGHAGVASVAATDASIVVGGSASAPTIATGTLDVVATQHPPAAAVPMNSKTLTGVGASAVTLPNFGGVFGDGSDGALNFDGTTTILGIAPSTGVYTLNRDIFATTIQVGGGATTTTIITNGWRIFHQGACTIAANGSVSAAGISATLGSNQHTAGGGTGSGTLGGGRSGSAGVASGSANPGTGSSGVATGSPGGGGIGSSGTGGASIGASAGTATVWLKTPEPVLATALFNSSGIGRVDGGGGGSGGGGDGTNFGGGGGGGGGVVAFLGWSLVNNGTITAAGGNGGTPTVVATNGGCGGGGGGAGGLVLIYTLSAVTGSGSISVAGGTGGTKVTNGTGTAANGSNGTIGNTVQIVLA